MIPQVKVEKNALSNLRGIFNALCALEGNWLKKNTLSALHFLACTLSSSLNRIHKNIFPNVPEGAS